MSTENNEPWLICWDPQKKKRPFQPFPSFPAKMGPTISSQVMSEDDKVEEESRRLSRLGEPWMSDVFSPFATGGDHRLYTNYSSLTESRVSKIGHHFRM